MSLVALHVGVLMEARNHDDSGLLGARHGLVSQAPAGGIGFLTRGEPDLLTFHQLV